MRSHLITSDTIRNIKL
jgi:CDGSH-type Zn-finger protein